MSEFLDLSTWSVLQWVLVVLAAGFIGQFGKSFAQFVMAKIKAVRSDPRREDSAVSPAVPPLPAVAGERPATPNEEGTGKVVGDNPAEPVETSPGEVPMEYVPGELASTKNAAGEYPLPFPDKKTLKAQLKRRKKAVKAAKKARE